MAKRRRFDGKIYSYYESASFKKDLDRTEEGLRKRGYNVRRVEGRITKPTGRRQYHLFIRKKKRR